MSSTRGITAQQEIRPSEIFRDSRAPGQMVHDMLSKPSACAIVLFIMGATAWKGIPALSDIALLAGTLLFLWHLRLSHKLPGRMPITSHLPDPGDIHPGTGKPVPGRGILFMGSDLGTQEEVWFSDDDVRTHMLLFGSTGSGKTEALVSIAFNSLAMGSGFVYVDGKGDNALYKKIYFAVRAMGREDDLLLINYMTGGRSVMGKQRTLLSNKMNPFTTGAGSDITNLVVGLMDSGSGDKGGDMWKGRAISFISAVVPALVYKRDNQGMMLDVSVIRQYMEFSKVLELARDRDIPPLLIEPIKAYLSSLAGYVERKGANQESTTLEQHGYLQMQFTRIMGSLADTYGFVFRSLLGDVDMYDVVVNRRILVVLLPALEKPDDELSNLGKIIVSSMKGMMGATLGSEVEGETRRIVDTKPTNSPTPYTVILDEYGYYAVDGFAVMAAQARSLGFFLIYAGQDFGSFKKRASESEANAIVGNTNIKGFMKLEDTDQTLKLAEQAASEAYVTHTSGFQMNSGGISNSYMDTKNASIEKRSRIHALDLKAQDPGYVHIIWRDKIFRMRMFYANPESAARMRVNHFIQVLPPQGGSASMMDASLGTVVERLRNPSFVDEAPRPYPMRELDVVAEAMRMSSSMGPLESAIIGIVAFHQQNVGQVQAMRDTLQSGDMGGSDGEEFDGNSVLGAITHAHEQSVEQGGDDFISSMFGSEAAMAISQTMTAHHEEDPVPDANILRKGLEKIEQATGATPEAASETAERVVSEVIESTAYPSMPAEIRQPEVLLDVLNDLDSILRGDAIFSGDDDEEEDDDGSA